MRQSELDLARKVWNIPGERTKNGHPHSVPLSEMAIELIKNPPAKAVVAAHLSQTIQRVQDRFGLDQWTPHDLRRTALTKMAELGVAPIVLGHIANHRTTTRAGVTLGVYVQHHMNERNEKPLSFGLIGYRASSMAQA